MTHDEKLKAARRHIALIRSELAQLEDVLDHAGSFNGYSFDESLMRSFQHAQSAVVHAVQTARPRVTG